MPTQEANTAAFYLTTGMTLVLHKNFECFKSLRISMMKIKIRVKLDV